jgi:hypothetical protein
MQPLLDLIAEDVRSLSLSAVQRVGALVSLQDGLPPAAEAVMRLNAFAAYRGMEFAKLEISTQLGFLKAIAMDHKVLVPAAFISRLPKRTEATFEGNANPSASYTTPAPTAVPASPTDHYANKYQFPQ